MTPNWITIAIFVISPFLLTIWLWITPGHHAFNVLFGRLREAGVHTQGRCLRKRLVVLRFSVCSRKRIGFLPLACLPMYLTLNVHIVVTLSSNTNSLLLFCCFVYIELPFLQKETPDGKITESAHPARFSPDDKFSRQRVACKKRFGIYLPNTPQKPM